MALRFAALVVAACVLSAGAAAQIQENRLSLSGTVINTSTGEPVKRALVQIIRYGPQEPGSNSPPRPFTASALADLQGVFQFDALAAGTYTVTAQKPGFIPQFDAPGTSSTVKLDSSVGNIKLRLAPLGVLTGRVADQTGQALRDVAIVLLKVSVQDGLRRTNIMQSGLTDDRGMYRLWNLQPGKYFVKAAGQRGGTYSYVGSTTPQLFAEESFAPVYFGGARTLDSAVPIEIEAGAEARADLTLRLEPAHKIRGSLTNFVARSGINFELLSGDEDVSASRVTMNADTGRFEIQDVVPGSYILRARLAHGSAEAAVNVGNSDVNGVPLALAPDVDVKVSVLLTNAQMDAPFAGGLSQGRGSGFCEVRLHPVGARSGMTYTASEDGESGGFAFRGVMPGAYLVSPTCYGCYARSAMSGSQDLLANPVLTIQPGTAPPPIEIVATSGGGTIRGLVSADSSSSPVGACVLLVPQFAGSTGPVLVNAYQFSDQAVGFRFEARNLAPGSYMAYAFSNPDDIEFRNPQFLQSLSGGVLVQVEDGSEKNITIPAVTR
jgi:protocatechuate 3,4-dioxygenase beta subunit